jgi:hypothetical protein
LTWLANFSSLPTTFITLKKPAKKKILSGKPQIQYFKDQNNKFVPLPTLLTYLKTITVSLRVTVLVTLIARAL